MCGIAGYKGFVDHAEMASKANSVQLHRGPDAQGVWSSENLSLAHQRLSIIDLNDRSNQPFEKHNLIIVFNGEIYNYKELKIQLESGGVKFRTTSDTEVVLEMYYKYGVESLAKFEGMFAFAIFDSQTESLFIARDCFGIKPLFYFHNNKQFAFASELKALAHVLPIQKKLNYQALIGALNYLWVPGDESILDGIHKLPPAHFGFLDKNNNFEVKRYWKLEDYVQSDISESEAIQNLGNALEYSIQQHLVADVEVGAFLSGGLDSSLICSMASKYNKQLNTFTIATSQEDKKIERMSSDEVYAGKLAKEYGFKHHQIEINPRIVEDLPQMVSTLDEPIGDPAALNTYLICNEARERGIKVLLSGMGADEVFFGYRRQKATLMAQKYQRLPWLVRRISEFGVNALPVRVFNRGIRTSRWGKKFISFANLDLDEAYRMSYSYYNHEQLDELMLGNRNAEILAMCDSHHQIFNSMYDGDMCNQMCHTDMNMFMVGLNLTYSDRASMAASTEIRVPFIDRNVIEVAMSLPGRLKYYKNESKYILKKYAEKHLPKNIIYRPKASFGAPIRSWISKDLSEMVSDLLSRDAVIKRGLFDPDFVKALIDNDRKGVVDNAYQIYQLLSIELWMREFFDK